MGLYEREVRFYTDVAPGLHGPVAPCHHAAYDPSTGVFDLLLGDAAPAIVGDEIRGATAEQAMLALTQLGRVHGPLLGDPTLAGAEWLNRESPVNQGLVARAVRRLTSTATATRSRRSTARCASAWSRRSTRTWPRRRRRAVRRVLIHGDYRLDNMLFGEDGADRPLTVVDWQTVTWGPAFTDVAYFLGCALPVAQRRDAVRRAAARLSRRARSRCRRDPRRRARRRATPELLRGAHVDRVADAGRAHRSWRRDVHGDDGTALPSTCSTPTRWPCFRSRRPQNRCSPTPMTRARTRRPTSRCGAKAGTSTSPTRTRTSAAGCGSA